MNENRIVITGVGFVTPAGIGKSEFWHNICYGDPAVDRVFLCDAEGINSQVAGQVKDFNGLDHGLSENEVERLDRFAQFGLVAAIQAVADAQLTFEEDEIYKIAVVTASAVGAATNTEKEWKKVSCDGQSEINAQLVGKYLYHSATPHQLSIEVKKRFKLGGPVVTVSTGCTSGIDVVGYALEVLQFGEADVCICGSAEAPVTRIALDAFDRIGALSTAYNDTPEKASRPFDKNRDGFVLGEGAGCLVMETLEHAQKRNARIYCEVLSYASVCNAIHMTGLNKDDDSTAIGIETALERANVKKTDVSYINAHGSATEQNDVHETASYKKVFGDNAYQIPISGFKSSMGHSLGGIGTINIAGSALAIKEGLIPPTKNYETPDPACDLDYVPNTPRKADLNVVVVNGNSFSGIHSTVILRKI